VKATGRTLTAGELIAELHRLDPATPIRLAAADLDEAGHPVREVTVTGTAVTVHTDPELFVTDEQLDAVDLLRRYVAKTLTAAQLRREAVSLVGPVTAEEVCAS
jgi:hypothetical protein